MKHTDNKILRKIDLEFILGQIEDVEKEHLKANVYYDSEENRIKVVYPLPPDYIKLRKKDIQGKHKLKINIKKSMPLEILHEIVRDVAWDRLGYLSDKRVT